MVAKIALQALAALFVWVAVGVLLVMNDWPRTGWTVLGLFGALVVYLFAYAYWPTPRKDAAAAQQEPKP